VFVCALADDLYPPSYAGAQPLRKESQLARIATRYKIDISRVIAAVRAELTKPANAAKRANGALQQQRKQA
jgi:GTP cyclohydrolase III